MSTQKLTIGLVLPSRKKLPPAIELTQFFKLYNAYQIYQANNFIHQTKFT